MGSQPYIFALEVNLETEEHLPSKLVSRKAGREVTASKVGRAFSVEGLGGRPWLAGWIIHQEGGGTSVQFWHHLAPKPGRAGGCR